MTNPNINGGISEARFALLALRMGWEISKPYLHAYPYDFVIKRSPHHAWETVQVKTAYFVKARKKYAVDIRRTQKKAYLPGDFDLLFISSPDGRQFLIPFREIANSRSSLTLDNESYGRFRLRVQNFPAR